MAYVPNSGSVVAFQSLPSSLLTGSSIFGQLPGGTAMLGSVAAYQGNSPWNFSGSVAAFQVGTQITSVVNSIPSSLLAGVSILGQLPAGTATLGSVVAYQGASSWNIGGSVLQFQAGTQISSIVNTVPSSVQVGASLMGQLPAGTALIGSVAVLQGTNPWNISSVYGNISGSVVATQGTNPWVIGSINGTFAEDAGHTSADLGLFALGVRNDTLASTVSADKDYTAFGLDSAGRILTKPFVSDDGTIINFTSSTVSTSVMLIKASAIGKKNYVTDFWISNTGALTTLITFQDGSTSVLGYTIAPAGGGSNAQGIHVPFKTATSQDLALKPGTGTSILYVTVQGYQAP